MRSQDWWQHVQNKLTPPPMKLPGGVGNRWYSGALRAWEESPLFKLFQEAERCRQATVAEAEAEGFAWTTQAPAGFQAEPLPTFAGADK